ncbi:MAG TPA: hypothetical protein PKN70_09220 [Smithellaceae bacterium]|nr:hypothetical protein [Smithellaceae bacterium]HQM46429.1 hypothetical protein [Smithellaceae bacterium]
MRKRTKMMVVAGLAGMICCLIGCAGLMGKDAGRFEPSDAAFDHFEKFVFSSEYQYFIGGSDVYPLVLFGLNRNYRIDSDESLWKKIDPNREVLSELVSNMQRRAMECCMQSPHGFDILDGSGQKIGEAYTMLGFIMGIKMKGEGKVVIYPPIDNDEVKRYQDRSTGRSR